MVRVIAAIQLTAVERLPFTRCPEEIQAGHCHYLLHLHEVVSDLLKSLMTLLGVWCVDPSGPLSASWVTRLMVLRSAAASKVL